MVKICFMASLWMLMMDLQKILSWKSESVGQVMQTAEQEVPEVHRH